MSNVLWDALFAPLETRDRDVMILPDGRRIGGPAFLAMIARQAHALRAAGLGAGDRIAVQVAKSPEALATYGAAVALGAIFLPLNTAYTADEVDYFLGNATPRVFLCDPARAAALAPVAARHGAVVLTLGADGQGSLTDAAAGQPATVDPVARGADDLAAFLYTSGTTGRSKGAMLSHGNLLSNAQVLADLWRFTDRDVLYHALPIFHTHGLFVASNICLLTGAAMIFCPGFDAEQAIRLLPQATTMMGVPTFYTRLLDDPRLNRDLVAHMRLFVSGSAPLLAETHVAWEARTGHRILERYGMTETNMNTSNPYEGERRAGTVGFPLPGVELRITGPEGAALPQGEVGVIEVRGPNVFKGYWQMPDKTAEDMRADGFFITGDLGMVDADGYVHIVGRAKDLIITGGYNVYPKEIEMALDEVPGVLESAVIGLPHPDFGEAVFAVLVAQKGAALEAQAALDAIRGKLARFKQPKAAVVVDALPRNTMGKVQKNLLRDSYRGTFTG
ncbi:MAG TPA: malonyl-CoA synthase [Paracoccaceae bacterium]|nr:malonyl-CoA synthase [Paracoccaceae bacterium]